MSSELVIPKMQSSPLISLKDPIKMSSTEVSLFSFIRTSPGTENSGVFQFMRIVTTCQYLKHQGILPRFNDICPFNAKNVSRYTLLKSPQFQRLVDAIHEVTSPVMVVVTSMNRLGVSYDSIQGALDRLTNNRSNVKVVCLDSFGINNSDHARDLSEYYESISKIECNHIDAGRGMNVSSHHMRERNTYFEYAAQLKSEWNSGADLPTYIHEACVVGSQLPRKSLTNRRWIKQSLIDMVNGEDVENIVKNYPFKCKDSPKQRYVAIYMRTSPESRPLTISDDILPKDQLSKCMAFYYLNNEISSRKLLIFNDVAKYRMSLTAGYVNLISRIVLGEVSNVIVKCTNRISSNYEKSMMLLEICRQFRVEIHFVADIGLNYAEVIRRDSQRVCTRQAILKKLMTSTKEKLEAANETKTNSIVKKFFNLCREKLVSQRMMVIDDELDLEIDEETDDGFDD